MFFSSWDLLHSTWDLQSPPCACLHPSQPEVEMNMEDCASEFFCVHLDVVYIIASCITVLEFNSFWKIVPEMTCSKTKSLCHLVDTWLIIQVSAWKVAWSRREIRIFVRQQRYFFHEQLCREWNFPRTKMFENWDLTVFCLELRSMSTSPWKKKKMQIWSSPGRESALDK